MNEASPHASLPAAPFWAIALGSAGKALIIAACVLFLAAAVAKIVAGRRPALGKAGVVAFCLGAASLFGAFATLAALFLRDQFQYSYVFERAERSLHPAYKLASVWAGQQGSFLLWACTSALFGLLALRAVGPYRRWFTASYAVFLAALAAILAYESPFNILPQAIVEGRVIAIPNGAGMTPALQNYWVVIHPPVIFLGFGSLTVLFCWALSAILSKDLKTWVSAVRPWALLSLAILGLGICMGGFWAYETLGWGGFWAWDPVENASFVPWLFVVALVHGLIVQAARGRWAWTNLLLAAAPFACFLYGTWLTRSGMLTEASVHSFAEMDRSAHLILLGTFIAAVSVFIALWATRGRMLARAESAAIEPGVSRENTYKVGVLLISLLGISLAIGMSVPFFLALAGRPSKVVEESLYHLVVPWFFVPIMALIALAPFVTWRSMGWRQLLARFLNVLCVAFGLLGFLVFLFKLTRWGGLPGSGATANFPFGSKVPLFFWVMTLVFFVLVALVANVWRIAETWSRSRSSLGAFMSHAGLAVLMAGLIISRGFERKEQVLVQPGIPARALDYVVQFDRLTSGDPFDRSNKALFRVEGPGQSFIARPGLYYTRGRDGSMNAMMWPHVEHGLTHDVYFTLYEPVLDLWEKPEMLLPGQSKTLNGVTVTYKRLTREGEPGKPGTKFGAVVDVKTQEGTFEAHPKMVLTAGGLRPELAAIPGLQISMMGMDVATRAANIQVHFYPPIHQVELFYKPMTILVWLGAGILVSGGLLAAYARRRSAKAAAMQGEEAQAGAAAGQKDALVPAT